MPFPLMRSAIVSIFCVFCARDALAQQYTVTDLGTLGSDSSAAAINARGQVVGRSTVEGRPHAFIWTDGTMQDLGLLPGADSCVATAVNDSGHVAGFCSGYGETFPQVFLWTEELGMQPLPIRGLAWGLNSQDTIVGVTESGTYAFVYRDGKLNVFDRGAAFGINDHDQIVGWRLGVVVVWDEKGRHDIDSDRSSNGWAISESGIVAGESGRGGGPSHAVLWTPYGISDLGTLAQATSTSARAINGDLVVGLSWNPYESNYHAFLYDTNGPGYALDLNDLIPADSGWVLQTALCINAAGQIGGSGTVDGLHHAFLLTPVQPKMTSR